MYIYLHVYIMISAPPDSQCFGKELRETLFTKSTAVHRCMIAYKGRLSLK